MDKMTLPGGDWAGNKNELLRNKVRLVLTKDLLKPKYIKTVTESDPPETGHCYIAAEALWHLIGGISSGYVPQVMRVEYDTHWFLKKFSSGEILDPTKEQFPSGVDYELGRACGFLTKKPSKRAQILIDRVKGGI